MTPDASIDNVVVAILAAVLLGACSSADGGPDDDTVHFTPLERQSTVVEPVSAPSPPISLEDRPSYRQIIEGFRKGAVELFERDGIERRLDQIERVFVGTGKYLELVAIYQDVYAKLGLESPVADRLAWAYIRLGQRQKARSLIDEVQRARPDDPTVAFLEGFYWMNAGQDSQKALARAALQWRRVLALDSDFSGFGRVSARSLKMQIRQIERRLPKAPDKMVDIRRADDGGQEAAGGAQKADAGEPTTDGKRPETGGDGAKDEETGPGGEAVAEAETPAKARRDEKPETDDAAAGEPPQEAEKSAAAESTASPKKTKDEGPTPVGVLIMRADEALGNDNVEKARRIYQKVLDRDSDHVGARMGMLRADWKENPEDSALADRARSLAENAELSARELYDLGLFAKVRLENPKLAESIWKRVRKKNPDFADQVGIGK